MAPIRSRGKQNNAEASTSKTNSSHRTGQSQAHYHQSKPKAIPGKQKLKSSLRQARRLLAKDNVAADKRVEAERWVKALEADLEQVDQAQKERTMAIRYHKIKFFERQKVTRRLTQNKKRLKSADESERKQASSQLLEDRVNLNYILHYPKAKKYISLFPPEVRQGEVTVTEASEAQSTKTNQDREEIRSWIRERMQRKELPSEPELHLESGSGRSAVASSQYPSSGVSFKTKIRPQEAVNDTEADDFFESEGGDSEE